MEILMLLIGAGLGVGADRLLRRVEHRRQLLVIGEIFDRPGVGSGVRLSIKNNGKAATPRLEVAMESPEGDLHPIFHQRSNEIPPGETVFYDLPIVNDSRVLGSIPKFLIEEDRGKPYCLVVREKASGVILLKDKRFGANIANVARALSEGKSAADCKSLEQLLRPAFSFLYYLRGTHSF